MTQQDAINRVVNLILANGYRHTNSDVNNMLSDYYKMHGKQPRDFSRAIDKVQKIVKDNEVGAEKLY